MVCSYRLQAKLTFSHVALRTWTNSYNPNVFATVSSRPAIMIDVQQAFIDDLVLACYEEAYQLLGSGSVTCEGVLTQGLMYLNYGINKYSLLPPLITYFFATGSVSAGPVNVSLDTLTPFSSSTWTVTGFWPWWNVSSITQQVELLE
jgi:hypothetical protein